MTNAERDLEEFLGRLQAYQRKFLQGELLTSEEWSAWRHWPQDEQLEARKEFLKRLERVSDKYREYRKRVLKNVLEGLPPLTVGAPKKDELASEIWELHNAGKSYAEIADGLNNKYGADTATRESVRKMVDRQRRSTPDKTH